VLLDFYCTLVDLSDPVRSRGFDDLARRLGLPLGPGGLCRRYAEMISSEPAGDGGSAFVPYRPAEAELMPHIASSKALAVAIRGSAPIRPCGPERGRRRPAGEYRTASDRARLIQPYRSAVLKLAGS
jgi:hypothetical protein